MHTLASAPRAAAANPLPGAAAEVRAVAAAGGAAAGGAPAVGIGWRHAHYAALLEQRPALDFIEVHSENFFAPGGAALAVLREGREHYPVSLHGVGLSLGSAHGVDPWHLDQLARLVQAIEPLRVSDHASFARGAFVPAADALAGGMDAAPMRQPRMREPRSREPHLCAPDIHAPDRHAPDRHAPDRNAHQVPVPPVPAPHVHAADLLPLPFSQAALDVLCANVGRVQDRLRRPIAVENISAYLQWPAADMNEPTFLNALARRSGCQLLVDVNNLYVNALNAQRLGAAGDPISEVQRWLDAIDPQHVVELHLAGHSTAGALVIDDHGSRVGPEVWALHAHALRRFGPVPTLIEWDTDVPALDVLLGEAALARASARSSTFSSTFSSTCSSACSSSALASANTEGAWS